MNSQQVAAGLQAGRDDAGMTRMLRDRAFRCRGCCSCDSRAPAQSATGPTGRSGAGRRATASARLALPCDWPASLTKRWEVTVGAGHASPVIAGNRVVLHAREGEREVVRAIRPLDRQGDVAQRLRRAVHDELRRRAGMGQDRNRRRSSPAAACLHVRHQRHPVGARSRDRQAALANRARQRHRRSSARRCRRSSTART